MKVAGVDLSTFAIDVVTIDLDDQLERFHWRLDIQGDDAFDRTRNVRDVLPPRSWWNDIGVTAVAIEEPAGRNPGFLFRVQGAILACLPRTLLVEKFMPSEWRKGVGLPGNCTKDAVRAWVVTQVPTHGWTPDQHDAYCLARAVRPKIETVAA